MKVSFWSVIMFIFRPSDSMYIISDLKIQCVSPLFVIIMDSLCRLVVFAYEVARACFSLVA